MISHKKIDAASVHSTIFSRSRQVAFPSDTDPRRGQKKNIFGPGNNGSRSNKEPRCGSSNLRMGKTGADPRKRSYSRPSEAFQSFAVTKGGFFFGIFVLVWV